jgi:hypothetical protein
MFTKISGTQQKSINSPLEELMIALHVSRDLQADYCEMSQDRVDQYFEDVEGAWIEKW